MAHRSNRGSVQPQWLPAAGSGSSQILPFFLLLALIAVNNLCRCLAGCQKPLLLSYIRILRFSNLVEHSWIQNKQGPAFRPAPVRLASTSLAREVTGNHMTRTHVTQLGLLLSADRLCNRAPRPEVTSAWRIDRARKISFEHNTLPLHLNSRIRDGHCRQQSLRIWMQRMFVNVVAFIHFDDLPQVRYKHTITDMLDHCEVMGDEKIGESQLLLQIFEHVHNLGLNTHIKS